MYLLESQTNKQKTVNKPELWPINSVALTQSPMLDNESIMSLKFFNSSQ